MKPIAEQEIMVQDLGDEKYGHLKNIRAAFETVWNDPKNDDQRTSKFWVLVDYSRDGDKFGIAVHLRAIDPLCDNAIKNEVVMPPITMSDRCLGGIRFDQNLEEVWGKYVLTMANELALFLRKAATGVLD